MIELDEAQAFATEIVDSIDEMRESQRQAAQAAFEAREAAAGGQRQGAPDGRR